MDRRRDDVGLREIGDGRAEREQADPGGHAQEIRRADQFGQRREGAASNALLSRIHVCRRVRHAFNSMDTEHGCFQEGRGRDQQVDWAERR
jgi:hypothetical protein